MCSHRTLTFESIWSENIKGWYQSDGVLLLYTPDIERYRDGYFNLVDPYRLPGITLERFEREAADGGKAGLSRPGGSDFAGSVGLNGNGLSAMFLKPADGVLEARKSWFFLGNQIVCLGAGIGANSENVIETVVENARLVDEAQKLVVNGKPVAEGTVSWPDAKWAFLTPKRPGAELGWVFLQGNPKLNTLIETRKGARTDTHPRVGDPTPISMRFATLWLDHGKGLSNSTYAYVILPGQDVGKVGAYAERPGVEILSNTSGIQAVRDKSAGVTGVAAYQPGEVADITLNEPALAMIEEKSGTITLAISDPTMRLKTPVRLKTSLAAKSTMKTDERIKVISLSPLEIEFKPDGLNGQSHTAEFSR
jgi:hyaluronate lyase